MMLYASAMLKVVMKNNLYVIHKYLIILVNKFNPKPINHKPVNKLTYVMVGLSVVIILDKNNIGATNENKIKLVSKNNSLTVI
jgi:hypothetical protein